MRNIMPRSGAGAGRQGGAVAIMAAGMLLIILAFFALALDLSRVYNRRAEMHSLADSIAVAAARKLNGTADGISAAQQAAKGVVEDPQNGPQYQYVEKMRWSDAALRFGAARDGSAGWKSGADARADPAGLMYVKADTAGMDSRYGSVWTFFASMLSGDRTVGVSDVSIAGRGRLNVTPLGLCAMSTAPQSRRISAFGSAYDELVEYGFRRGVSYNLMKLNPAGAAPMSFQVDPIALAGSGSSSTHFQAWLYEPYVCSGTMAVPRVTGAAVGLQGTFPIASYYTQLNARFDPYTGTCDANASPPDSNIKPYTMANSVWMTPKPVVQGAVQDSGTTTRLQTVADAGPPNYPAAAGYGPLWTYAPAVPWSSFQQKGTPEPAEGYVPFAATGTVWKALYGTDSGVSGYPSIPPYLVGSGTTFFQAPSTAARKPGARYRRVLNLPLFACPVSGSAATVLAIGKFFMTVPADVSAIYAEFAGITREDQLGGPVEIYQ